MRISGEFKKSGIYWLPSNPSEKISGFLIITDGGHIKLELFGTFGGIKAAMIGSMQIGRIVGAIEDDGMVTLENCYYLNRNVSFTAGISKSEIYVDMAYLGVAFQDNNAAKFDKVKFSIEGLDEWINISGISVTENRDDKTVTMQHRKLEPISFNLKNDTELNIEFYTSRTFDRKPQNFNLTQRAGFSLTTKEHQPLDDFIYLIHKLTNLMCFALDMNVCLHDVYCYSSDILRDSAATNKSDPLPIKLYYRSTPYTDVIPKPKTHNMIFRYADIQSKFSKVVNSWLKAYDIIAPALNLYFSNKIGAHKYLDGQFLALAQALETYHRRTSKETFVSKDDYKLLMKDILDTCPEQHKEWLKSKLVFGNEISLRKRLERVIEAFKAHVGTDMEVEELIKQIVNTRNYLTHYNQSLKKKAVQGGDLWYLIQKMEAILQLHLLKQLGFDDLEISHVLDKTHRLKDKLKGSF